MPRKPSVSGDGNIWGQVLNDYLDVAHNLDGTLKTALPVATKTAAYTLTTADRIILADTTLGAFALTLPAPSGATGMPFQVKQKAGNNALTVATASGTIDGVGTFVFPGVNSAYTFISDGTSYFIF